ncbi:MAG: hypothetical protein HDS02_04045 [Bacteroides sp.]|nr:hypothetical protein [Bacteroides sp.]MBD5375954.1 hypothetical protein [Bacteroides sp.]
MTLIQKLSTHITAFIERQQELMFNERDFQMQLAVALRSSGSYDDVDVEYFIPNSVAAARGYEWNSDLRLDIVVRKGNSFAVVELKYPTRRIVTTIRRFNTLLNGVEIVKNHGAQDIVSYNFWKDVRRIEIIKSLFPESVVGGIAVMLTNDAYYTRGPRQGSICDAFSTANGRAGVHGILDWTRHTATANGLTKFSLEGNYSLRWKSTEIENNEFYYTLIEIR